MMRDSKAETLDEKDADHVHIFPVSTMDLSSVWTILQQGLVVSSFQIFVRSTMT